MSENIKVTFDTAEEDLHVNLDAGAIMYGKMQIGTTTTGESGTEAKVENVGSQTNAILNFTIPKGDKGEQGEKGEKGDTGSPVEVKDIPANTNIDEFYEEGLYAWNGDDGKAITGLPATFSGVDIPQCEYILRVTKLSSRTSASGKLMETYEYNFSFAGILLYTQVRTVFTNLETGKKSYMNRSWKKIAMSDENGLVVSSTEPTIKTEKAKVWLQKGKNYFNKNDLKITNAWQVSYTIDDNKKLEMAVTATGGVAFVRTNTFKFKAGTYTFSATTQGQLNEIRTYKNSGSQITTSTSNTFTFTLTEDTSIYFEFYVYNTSLTNSLSIENIQIERGTSATEYEEYVDKKIYTKNDNGVYEEFLNADEVKNDYSLGERRIGTWIDGKPLYRKVIQTTAPTVSTDGTFSSNGTVIADGVTNAIIEWGYVVDTDNQNMYLPYTTNNGYIIKCFINSSKALYLTSNGTSFSNKTVIISVLYTKTTDVATTSEE